MRFSERICTLLIVGSALSGCTQGVKFTLYEESAGASLAKITFKNADPFYYDKGVGMDASWIIVSSVAGAYRRFSAIVYDDNEVCKDGRYFPVINDSDRQFDIPAGQLLTFMVNTFDESKDKRVSCPVRFSFVPQADEEYVVRNSIRIKSISYGYCQVEVFDSADEVVDIIAREDVPLLWTQGSPRCSKSELDVPVVSKISKQRFSCMLRMSRRQC